MKKITLENLKGFALKVSGFAIITAAFIATISHAQWIGPTQPFPYGNVSAPINTASSSQTKSGPLFVTGLTSYSGGYFASYLQTATATNPIPLGLVGLFGGKIGATAYCDATGTKCNNPVSPETVHFSTGPLVIPSYNSFSFVATSDLSAPMDIEIAIPKSILASNSALIAAESRDIAGIIVGFRSGLSSDSNAQAIQEKWYRIKVYNPEETTASGNRFANFIYYDDDAGISTDPLEGSGIVIMDINNDDSFRVKFELDKKGLGNVKLGTRFFGNLSVLGYITR